MLKKSISYTDFNGEDHTEDFYFNMTKAELVAMELSGPNNSFRASMQKIIDSNNGRIIIQEFEKLISKAYGQRSPDGKLFLKSDEISLNFRGSGAYEVLFLELTTDAEAASAWVRGVMPEGGVDATSGKTPSQTARERSEAQMQGHQNKKTPEIPTSAPVLEEPDLEDEAAVEFVREERRRALQAQLDALDESTE